MDYFGLEKHIFKLLDSKLPNNLYYHGLQRTKDVLDATKKYIVEEEIVDRKERILLKTAALLHDSGFIIGYDQHEEKGVILAHEILPKFGYMKDDIEVISGLILATKVPQSPQNQLEQILCDCVLDYLGRSDFQEISENLFKEWTTQGIVKSRKEFDLKQFKFLESHQFFTGFAKRNRSEKKQQNLEELKNKITSKKPSAL